MEHHQAYRQSLRKAPAPVLPLSVPGDENACPQQCRDRQMNRALIRAETRHQLQLLQQQRPRGRALQPQSSQKSTFSRGSRGSRVRFADKLETVYLIAPRDGKRGSPERHPPPPPPPPPPPYGEAEEKKRARRPLTPLPLPNKQHQQQQQQVEPLKQHRLPQKPCVIGNLVPEQPLRQPPALMPEWEPWYDVPEPAAEARYDNIPPARDTRCPLRIQILDDEIDAYLNSPEDTTPVVDPSPPSRATCPISRRTGFRRRQKTLVAAPPPPPPPLPHDMFGESFV
jgi:hypothetical protein